MEKFTQNSLLDYSEKLASSSSVPGGGSASAYVATLGIDLSQMVARVALSRKKKEGLSAEEEDQDNAKREKLQQVVDALEQLKSQVFDVVDDDPEVYEKVMASWKDAQKLEEMLEVSYGLQADLAENIIKAFQLNSSLLDVIKGSIKNDLLVSASLLKGAFEGAFDTSMVNVVYMKDAAQKEGAEKRLQGLRNQFQKETGEGCVGSAG